MRMRLPLAAVVVALVGASAVAADKPACYGTKVDFADSPKEASELARKDEKLVFVLHVSGHFEDPRFT